MSESKLEALDLRALQRFLVMARVELAAAEQTLNSLNVYPVPDGDTGSNLRLTWESFFDVPQDVAGAVASSETASDEEVIRAGLRRLTAGARGNAGVIVSEYVRGCSTLLRFDEGQMCALDGDRIVRMLHAGAQAARRAVDQPVEGTVLSVADAAAAGAVQARTRLARAGGVASPSEILNAAVTSATEALRRSPQQLAVLAGAGVVDSGGAGLLFVLEAWARVAGGQHGLPRAKDRAWLNVSSRRGFAADQVCQVSQAGPAFEFMALAEGLDEGQAAQLRSDLSSCGDSVVVAGGDGFYRIHVHTDDVLGAASLVHTCAELSAPSVTRFAGPLEALSRIVVDVSDLVLSCFARACGFVTETTTLREGQGEFLITDGVAELESALGNAQVLGGVSAVHAVATLEACFFEAALDDEADFLQVAEDAEFLVATSASSWDEAREQIQGGAQEAEQLVVLIDPPAQAGAAEIFAGGVKDAYPDAVVLRVASGSLVQIGIE